MALVGARVGWRWFAGAYWRALRWLARCWLALAGWRGSKNVGHSIGEECRLHRGLDLHISKLNVFPLPRQPANLTVTQPASQPFRYPASQPTFYTASQLAFPLPSQPARLSVTQPATYIYQPASLPNPQTHTPPPCLLGLLVYRGGVVSYIDF